MPVRKLGPLITGVKPGPVEPPPEPTPEPTPEPARIPIGVVDPGYLPESDTFTVALGTSEDPTALRPTQVLVYVAPLDKVPTDPALNTPEFWESQGFPFNSAGIPETGDPGVISLPVTGIPVGPFAAQTVIEYPS